MRIHSFWFRRAFILLLTTWLLLSLAAPQPAGAAPGGLITVTGVVRDGTPSGHTYPLYAKIGFTSASLTPVTVFSDPFSGVYRASLVQNELVTATITPSLPGYPAVQVSFTPTTNPYTINFPVSANKTACYAPGYTNNKVFLETFDLEAPPALPGGWSVEKFGAATGSWTTTGSSAHPAGVEPFGGGLNMAAFNSYTATIDAAALLSTTTSTSLAGLSSAAISFWMYHDSGFPGSQDRIQAAVSTNGTNFSLVGSSFQRYSASPGWVFHRVDISSYAGPGKLPVYIGLRATGAGGNDMLVDDIAVGATTCLKSAGGLVAGFVSGAPGGLPVISALVANTARPSEQSYSAGRGEDAALQDGFYQLFSTVSGSQTFSVSALRHLAVQQSVNVLENGVTRLDLAPSSAWVMAAPNRVALTLAAGGTASLALVLSNPGTRTANFTVQPAAGLLVSGSTLSGLVQAFEEPASGPTLAWSGAPAQEGPPPQSAASGGPALLDGPPRPDGVTTPFPGAAGYRQAAASCDGETFYVFGGLAGSTVLDEVWM